MIFKAEKRSDGENLFCGNFVNFSEAKDKIKGELSSRELTALSVRNLKIFMKIKLNQFAYMFEFKKFNR